MVSASRRSVWLARHDRHAHRSSASTSSAVGSDVCAPNREAADKCWKAFRADPDWIKARDESEKNGKLVDKVESVFLNPTDYSPIK